MRKIRQSSLALIGLLVLALSARTASAGDKWWAEDKALHLSVSALIGAASYSALWWLDRPHSSALRLGLAASISLLPGLAKEIYDSTRANNHFCGKDMFWNAIGALVGSLAVFGIEHLARRDANKTQRLSLRVGGFGGGLSVAF